MGSTDPGDLGRLSTTEGPVLWPRDNPMGDEVNIWIRVMALSAGGILGVNARYWVGVWIAGRASANFPWATFAVNVTGSFAIGVTIGLLRHLPAHGGARLMLVTGLLGGYTTFSTFAYESTSLWERGAFARSLAYMVGSVASGFAAVLLGATLARVASTSIARDSGPDAPPARDGPRLDPNRAESGPFGPRDG